MISAKHYQEIKAELTVKAVKAVTKYIRLKKCVHLKTRINFNY